ncbi:hypothetical protein OG21DRAFT_1515452 [Imleria badia]|nr:hypothetical protein OG21DRAFT_1515452 [Imleria badia]
MQTEWDILQSYTRRIRCLQAIFNCRLDKESVKILSNPPTTLPLFPNLRALYCHYTQRNMPLLHLPFPSLIILDVTFEDPRLLRNAFNSFSQFSPNIREFVVRTFRREDTFYKIKPNYMCRWQNLSSVDCPDIALDVNTLVHLSRMPALSHLEFALTATSLPAAPDSPLVFSNLHDFALHSESLERISRFLSRIRLPTIVDFSTVLDNCPSRQELSSFSAGVQASNAGHTIERLRLYQLSSFQDTVTHSEHFTLCLEDLQPFMVFNLRHLSVDIEWDVYLTDTRLLALASAWPHLETLFINEECGWNTPCGITPDGLIQLLQTCRSLSMIGLAINTLGYTECRELPASLGLTLPPSSDICVPDPMMEDTPSGSLASVGLLSPPRLNFIDVLDSSINEESVPTVAAFFASIIPRSFTFYYWRVRETTERPGWEMYKRRWEEVNRRVTDAVSRRS